MPNNIPSWLQAVATLLAPLTTTTAQYRPPGMKYQRPATSAATAPAPRAPTPSPATQTGQTPNLLYSWMRNIWAGQSLQLPWGYNRFPTATPQPAYQQNNNQNWMRMPNAPQLTGGTGQNWNINNRLALPVNYYPIPTGSRPIPAQAPAPPPTVVPGAYTGGVVTKFRTPLQPGTPMPGYNEPPAAEPVYPPSGGYPGYPGRPSYPKSPRVGYAAQAPEANQGMNIAYRGNQPLYRQGAQTRYIPRWMQTPVQWTV